MSTTLFSSKILNFLAYTRLWEHVAINSPTLPVHLHPLLALPNCHPFLSHLEFPHSSIYPRQFYPHPLPHLKCHLTSLYPIFPTNHTYLSILLLILTLMQGLPPKILSTHHPQCLLIPCIILVLELTAARATVRAAYITVLYT